MRRVLSLWQPSRAQAAAYIAGVLHGDGFCTDLSFGLRVRDRDFAESFAAAVAIVTGIRLSVREDRGYGVVRSSNKAGRFAGLREYAPATPDEGAAWVRGLFDSEGNAYLGRAKVSEGAWNRRVSLYNTVPETIEAARRHLAALGVTTASRIVRASRGHLGSKPVHELKLRGSIVNYSIFADRVGSSIHRKAAVLSDIVASYEGLTLRLRAAQRKGVAARRARRTAQGAV